ncbi:MAG: site-2 protease family protein [Nitrospinae bacterium]|nr:site-2 protease family protein [Nitrospinota bacterium]
MDTGNIGHLIQTISVMAIPVVLAVTLHEVAHGYMAHLKGDDTAKIMGRLTLNPLAHVDIFGTVILPIVFYATTGFLFAYAKPVPVNFFNLRSPKRDMVWVSAAGPLTNVILAVISAFAIKGIGWLYPESLLEVYANIQGGGAGAGSVVIVPVIYMLYFSVLLNTILAVINLIPIPPADGGRIVVGLLPEPHSSSYARIEPFGMFLLIFILFFNPLHIIDVTIHPLIRWVLDLLL